MARPACFYSDVFDYPLNAIGKNRDQTEWMPFHMDTAGVHRDVRGIRIMQFHECKRIGEDHMPAWLEQNNFRPITALEMKAFGF